MAETEHRRWLSRRGVKIGVVMATVAVITTSIIAALTFSSPTPNIALLDLPVPNFSLHGLAPGQPELSAAALRSGGATVVNFWGSWCTPCTEEMPALQAVHRELGPQVRFVGIDEQDTRSAALSFIHQVGVTYESGFDGSGAVGTAFEISGTPTTYFISHGKMLDFHEGRLTKPQLLTYIRQIFGVS
jgi:thiol-disulfide isomerase/thioredoxin